MKGLIHKNNAQLIPGWHRALSAAAAAEGGSQQPGMGHRERARLRAQLADPATDSRSPPARNRELSSVFHLQKPTTA